MGRITQQKGLKGSLKWIQKIISESPSLLDDLIYKSIGYQKEDNIDSITESGRQFAPFRDAGAEYRDLAFLDLMGIELPKVKLKDFWPSRGPQWDALGRIKDETYFLVEAKAYALAMYRAILIIGSSETCHFLTDCNSY